MSERRYLVSIDGFPQQPVIVARTASAARYQAFRQLREAGYYSNRFRYALGGPFLLFLRDVRVRSLGRAQ